MNKRQKKPSGKARSEKHVRASILATELRFPGYRRDRAILNLKNNSSVVDLLFFAKSVFKNSKILSSYHGNPFPTEIKDFFSVQPYGENISVQDELKWALFRSSIHERELNQFIHLKEKFEIAVLSEDKVFAENILNEIEENFGVSIWLLQNRLTQVQVWEGFEKKRALANEYIRQVDGNILARILISFISKRSEATGLKNYLQEELNRLLGGAKNSVLENYVRTKLFDLGQIIVPNMATTLLFDAQVSLIDHYESLVLILQSVAVDDNLPPLVEEELYLYINSLQGLCDKRLRSVQRALNPSYLPNSSNIASDRSTIIELYSSGQYEGMIKLSALYLSSNLDDIAICALMSKALAITGADLPSLPGLLSEVCRLFVKIMEFGPDTYGAAFALYTMHDRYYGHQWAIMARGVMNNALAQETLDFPRQTWRYLLSLDQNLTPFTALALRTSARDNYRNHSAIRSAFPSTTAVLSTLLDGDDSANVDNLRLVVYRARHALIDGFFDKAASEFKKLMFVGHKVSRFQAAAYATLAYLKLGDIPAAVDAVVKGTLINKDVPIVMPIPEVTAYLNDSETWPDKISLPILFELSIAYFSEDKSTHLRVAFERFQMANDIREPEQLLEMIEVVGRDMVIAYLDRVWRPEIMMQTLLYETPQETEDARIAVCRVLAAIDPDNSAKYQEEIRDRVKRQEIAKGTTLVEQSKVYVDIAAIKKALNSRLGDTYTRYKAALLAKPTAPDVLVEGLADMFANKITENNVSIARAFSKLHLMNYKETEIDLQFSALFSEVTNEFLKGDHGLNAYLSTRVRHGTLANTLRKPLSDENLVTALREDEGGYLPNQYWDDDIVILPDEEQVKVRNALDHFTGTFDSIVEHVKNKLIQIKVLHTIAGSADESEALFVYQSSNLERRFLQEYDRNVTNIEKFVDRCIESLWEKTDVSLENVRRRLRSTVRAEFLNCFDRLSECVTAVSLPLAVINLSNAIARSRTAFQTKLNMVESWFNRQAVYDRQDYLPEYAVQIALNMVQKTLPNKNQVLNVEINTDCNSAMMPGRTLDSMVDVFESLLDNATIRSGLTIDSLKISVNIAFVNGKFLASVYNNISADKPLSSELEKVEAVRESLNKIESRARAQSEKGSGLLKIWRAIQSPVYKDAFFNFGYSEDYGFSVTIAYNIERGADEFSSN